MNFTSAVLIFSFFFSIFLVNCSEAVSNEVQNNIEEVVENQMDDTDEKIDLSEFANDESFQKLLEMLKKYQNGEGGQDFNLDFDLSDFEAENNSNNTVLDDEKNEL